MPTIPPIGREEGSVMNSGASRAVVIVAVGTCVLLGSIQGCTYIQNMNLIRWILERSAAVGYPFDEYPEIRIHLFEQPISAGIPIGSAGPRPRGGSVPDFNCPDTCRLVFVDPLPTAHFEHPTLMLVFNDSLSEIYHTQVMHWWPEVNGVPVFNTVEKRSEKRSILFTADAYAIDYLDLRRPLRVSQPAFQPSTPVPPATWALPTPTPTPAGAVLTGTFVISVKGYFDQLDSFAYDTDAFLTVASGLGVPDENIIPVEPGPTGAGLPDQCIKDVDQAFQDIKKHVANGKACEHLLLLWSSHGADGQLMCTHTENQSLRFYLQSRLASQLNATGCNRATILIEACKSGSVGAYLESKLTFKASIFTSTSENGYSHGDIDGEEDPNPGDVGSESIWGFLEAFTRSDPDENVPYRTIDFDEAVKWAQFTDYSTSKYGNTSMALHVNGGSKLESPAPHNPGPSPTDIFVDGITISPPGEANLSPALTPIPVVRCAPHLTEMTLNFTNSSAMSIANASVRILGRAKSATLAWPADAKEIGATVLTAEIPPGQSKVTTIITIDPQFAPGTILEIAAVVDSPTFANTGASGGSNAPSRALTEAKAVVDVQVVEDKDVGLDLCPNGC